MERFYEKIGGAKWNFHVFHVTFFFISNRSLCTDVLPPSEKKSGEETFLLPIFFWGRGDVCTQAIVIAVERPLFNQLTYPYRPQSFVSSEKDSNLRGLNNLWSDLNSRGIFVFYSMSCFWGVYSWMNTWLKLESLYWSCRNSNVYMLLIFVNIYIFFKVFNIIFKR